MKTLISAALFLVLASCSAKKEVNKITVAAAASTQFAINEIARDFEKENDVKIEVITGSSGKLTTQILNGAPYDIFFSADMMYPQVLFEKNKCLSAPKIYGLGIPVLWSLDKELIFDEKGKFLLNENIKKIAIGNPKNAPYGRMAVKFYKDYGIYDSISLKLVYGESISLVNEYILNKTATIGVSALSVILSPQVSDKGVYMVLGEQYRIKQGVVELNNNETSAIKTKFLAYVFSEKGKKIFKKYGYE